MTSRNDNIIRKWTPPTDIRVEIASMEQVVKVFDFEEIMKATRRFSPKNGVNGPVFRGTFEKKMKLAVKRTRMDANKEVNMLKKIYHFNLVKLEVCENHGCFYLFKFMENGSLREWLNRGSKKERRSSRKRIQIALDIANGLHYLHSFIEPAYDHNNINSSNILPNSNLRAKFLNISQARVIERATTASVLTTNLVGAKGYMAPEYREAWLVTPKIDIYASGVVVLELVSGKEAVFRGGREVLLSATMIPTNGENVEAQSARFLDSKIKETMKMEFGLQMVKLSAACFNQEPEPRPSMGEVLSNLLKIQVHLQKLQPSPLSYDEGN